MVNYSIESHYIITVYGNKESCSSASNCTVKKNWHNKSMANMHLVDDVELKAIRTKGV